MAENRSYGLYKYDITSRHTDVRKNVRFKFLLNNYITNVLQRSTRIGKWFNFNKKSPHSFLTTKTRQIATTERSANP